MRFLIAIAATVFLQFHSGVILSQTKDSVNNNDLKWSGFLTFSGLYQSGNTNKFNLQGRGELKRTKGIIETILYLSASYGESRQMKDDNTYFGSLTADLFYDNIFSPFFLQYAEYNFAKGIELRSQTGTGIKYLFIPDHVHKSSVSLAVIYDYLDLVSKPGNSNDREARFSFRLKSDQKLFEDRLRISFVGLYQPVINYFSKSNYYLEANLEMPLTKIFRLVAIYTYSFDNVVSVGRKRADNKLTFGAGLQF